MIDGDQRSWWLEIKSFSKSKSAKVTTSISMTAKQPAIPRMAKTFKIQKHKVLIVIPSHTPEDRCHIKKTFTDFLLNTVIPHNSPVHS